MPYCFEVKDSSAACKLIAVWSPCRIADVLFVVSNFVCDASDVLIELKLVTNDLTASTMASEL